MRLGYEGALVGAWVCCWGAAYAATAPPFAYDLKALYPQCQAFLRPFDQGTCASCCAAAIATQLSLRQCITHNKPNKLYSAQQIWDCAAPAAMGTCDTGVFLGPMIDAIGMGARSSRTLVDQTQCPTPLQTKDPNITQCMLTNARCFSNSSNVDAAEIGGVAEYHLSPYYASLEYASQLATRAMMNEIYENGPVVSVITFNSASDFANFASPSFLRNGRIFMPNASSSYYSSSHCLVVYGWDIDPVSGHKYWLVQNSYGGSWADGGFGRILQGADLLEGNWRGLFPSLPPPQNSTTTVPSSYHSSNDGQIILRAAPAESVGALPNEDIIILTFFTAIMFAALVVFLFSPGLFFRQSRTRAPLP